MLDDLVTKHEKLGEAVTKIITDQLANLDNQRVTPAATPSQLAQLFNEPLPETGTTAEALLSRFQDDIAAHSMLISSPRYFGQFNPTPLPIGVWADALASAINQNAGAWRNGPVAAIIEARVLRWLCDLLGYGDASFGTLTSGGSEANLIALKCARDAVNKSIKDRGVRAATSDLRIYASKQCHYSIEKSADILGLGRESLCKIPTDDQFRVKLDQLEQSIRLDREAGLIPCCIVGVAGATSTGVIDPLETLGQIARENHCWYHVDAAYGAALAFSAKHREKLRGIQLADSITFDPHKWLFVPFACGATLVRDGASVLRDSFDISPEYLSEDRGGADVEFDFFRYGQLGSRRFSSLKLWMAIKFMGRKGYEEVIDRHIELTKHLAERLDMLGDFRTLGQVETAVCCFQFTPERLGNLEPATLDRLQQRLQQVIEQCGEAWLTTTILRGRRALRVNINSFLTKERHVDDLVELLVREGTRLIEEFR